MFPLSSDFQKPIANHVHSFLSEVQLGLSTSGDDGQAVKLAQLMDGHSISQVWELNSILPLTRTRRVIQYVIDKN